jgi:chemotaxis protein MotB
MNMKKIQLLVLSVVVAISSCVPKKQLISEQNRVKELQSDSASTHNKLNDCNMNLSSCNSKVSDLEKQKADIESNLQNVSSTAEKNMASSNMTIAEQAKRLKDLQDLIQSQKDIVNRLKKTVADALVNFKPDELSVTIKDGKLYVSLQEKLLFQSGSAIVDPKGKQALSSLATVLNATPDINVMIEGHTDTVPIRGKFEDNWALSVSRATSIVRILTNDYKVDSHRVIASGRGEFYPVADNKTADGRAKNRRTEIVLSPNLNELFKLLNQ